jgi:hypothetical protein
VVIHTKILVRLWQLRRKSKDATENILWRVIAAQVKMIVPNLEGHDIKTNYYSSC